jgi:uncharacterized protein YdeI (YjbR/CyaY-like superfamily)
MTIPDDITARMNSSIDFFFRKAKQWKPEYETLRILLLECGLTEEAKWGVPCYTYEGNNIVLMHGFKDYCALLFFKGALMKDVAGILVAQTENVQSGRQIRFAHLQEIIEMEPILKDYVAEAIAVEKAGLKVEFKKTAEFTMPDELQTRFDQEPDFKAAFEGLTPGRQRGYLLYFAGAKQAKTRESRIEKCIPKILEGKGLND